jgi:hypothetical protein
MRAQIDAWLKLPNGSSFVRGAVSKLVVDTLLKVGRFYYHQEHRDYDTAMFLNRYTKELLRVRSDVFTAWLSNWIGINRLELFYRLAYAAAENASISPATATAIIPEAFWASRPGAIYLSNGNGSMAKIDANGVEAVDNGTDGVLFAYGRTLAPWEPAPPQDIFTKASLFRDLHAEASHARELLRLWLYSLPSNPRSKPPLCLAGQIGSGKTRIAKGFAEFLGLPFIAQKPVDDGESDFWPCCDQGGILTLDNADTRCQWLADAVANAATDGSSNRRKLYTNAETVTLRSRAWLCITTANPTFASDSGLADRLLVVRMARRDDQTTSDSQLTDEILAHRNAGLTYLAGILRIALADTAPTPEHLNQRHPDFASFAVRIGRALGRETEAIAALQAAERDKSAFCLENDSVATALLGHLREAVIFQGTAAQLLPHLCACDPELKDWLTPKRLGKRLSTLWPHLKRNLTEATVTKDGKGYSVYSFRTKTVVLP